MASGVGNRSTRTFFFLKYSDASLESSTMLLWPDPMISRSVPFSKMYLASSSEIVWDVPNTALDSFFFRFLISPESRMRTSYPISNPSTVMEPNSAPSILCFIKALLRESKFLMLNGSRVNNQPRLRQTKKYLRLYPAVYSLKYTPFYIIFKLFSTGRNFCRV